MTFLNQILKLAHSNLSNLEIDDFDELPCHSYLKQKNGQYISCSDEQAMAVGLQKRDDLINLTDADVLNAAEATGFRENDDKVIFTERPLISLEKFTWYDGRKVEATSIKTPLRKLNSKKIIGVAGVSILRFEDISVPEQFSSLTARQLDCLYYLARAYSIKQIGRAMGLSHRTIEHYLEAIKIKFDCRLRSDLVAMAMQIPSIRNRL
jgi:DNA-binding CsgD family transcriptional regulator